MLRLLLALLLFSGPAVAADVVIIGERHDNPAHHEAQARLVAELAPTALVFEMLSEAQAARITPDLRADPEALAIALDWAASGWGDFAPYYAIMAAAPEAAIFGAGLPRDEAAMVLGMDPRDSFGADADAYGLTEALDEADRQAREDEMAAAHCGKLPEEMLGPMVDIQRLRDAMLARGALRALAAHGAPVVVITGNGHARPDRGVPAVLATALPEVSVRAIGQGEDGVAPEGGFAEVLDAPGVDRSKEDPCAGFD